MTKKSVVPPESKTPPVAAVKAAEPVKTKRVRMLTSVSGVDVSYDVKGVYEVPEIQAKQWCEPKNPEHRYAEYVGNETPLIVKVDKVVTVKDVEAKVKPPVNLQKPEKAKPKKTEEKE